MVLYRQHTVTHFYVLFGALWWVRKVLILNACFFMDNSLRTVALAESIIFIKK